MSRPLPPGAVIGMLGGGQLGRMMACAAAQLGYDVHVFNPEGESPAARVSASQTVADYLDETALTGFAAQCDVVTYEFENVPVEAVGILERAGVSVRPGAKALENAQDRLVEKRFLNAAGIQTVQFEQIDGPDDIAVALESMGGKGILKSRREGYDGKGQARIRIGDDVHAVWKSVGETPCIIEALAPFECEISAIVARSASGEIAAYEPSENTHADGVLRASTAPARVSDDVRQAAVDAASRLADALGYIGVLALEFFVLPDGRLLANEYAPRVHNSGHWTPEACETGQFEQHIRAVAGLPLGSPRRLFDVRMDNLLGEEAIKAAGAPGVTLYGKGEPRPGRKMGHRVTRLGAAGEDKA